MSANSVVMEQVAAIFLYTVVHTVPTNFTVSAVVASSRSHEAKISTRSKISLLPLSLISAQVLHVGRDATTGDVKSSFYRQAKKLHPDVNHNVRPEEARRKFQELADAYATLSDANLRSRCAHFFALFIACGKGGSYRTRGDSTIVSILDEK